MSFGGLLGVVAVKLAVHQHTWLPSQVWVWVLSLLSWYATATWWCLDTPDMISDFSVGWWQWVSFPAIYMEPLYWLVVVLIVVVSLVKDVAWKAWKRMHDPQTHHVMQEMAGLSQAELLASLEHFNQLLSGTADGYGNVPESVKNDAPRLALAKVRSAWADASCHCAPCFTHLWQHCLQAAGRTLRMRTRAHSPCTRITAPPLFAAQTPSRAGSVGTPSLASSSLLHTSLRRAHSGSNSHSRTGSGGGGRNSNGGGNRNTASSASDPLLAPGM